MGAPTDERVEALLAARRDRVALDPSAPLWDDLSAADAEAVAQRLYRRTRADATGAWKLGALEASAQRRFGLAGPASAPVLGDHLHREARKVRIRLDDWIAPRFEAEVGIRTAPEPRPVPCVELADSRFVGWELPQHGLVADFCLQGGMVFGPAAAHPPADLVVHVLHDGEPVASAVQSWDDTLQRLDLLPDHAAPDLVATGAVTPLVPVRAGRWEFVVEEVGVVVVVA